MREAGGQDEGMKEAREGEVERRKREGRREPDVERRRGKGDAKVRGCVCRDGMRPGVEFYVYPAREHCVFGGRSIRNVLALIMKSTV